MFDDVGGYLTSTSFLAQVAALISAVLSAIFGNFITGLFSGA